MAEYISTMQGCFNIIPNTASCNMWSSNFLIEASDIFFVWLDNGRLTHLTTALISITPYCFQSSCVECHFHFARGSWRLTRNRTLSNCFSNDIFANIPCRQLKRYLRQLFEGGFCDRNLTSLGCKAAEFPGLSGCVDDSWCLSSWFWFSLDVFAEG